MFPQLDLAISLETSLKDRITYLTLVLQHHGTNIDERQCKIFKETIKEMVASPLTRVDGLKLFLAGLQQLTAFYVENWPNIIYANLSSSDKICQDITYQILKQILKPSQCEEHKSTVHYHIPKIVELLMDSNNAKNVSALHCLSLCLKSYPHVVASYKSDIEEFAIKHMDTNSPQQSEAIAECFLALPACYVSKNSRKDVTLHSSTLLLSKRLLYTLQETLNRLLHKSNGHSGGNENNEEQKAFELPPVPNMPFSSSMMFARMFASLSICLAKIMCHESLDTQFAMTVLEFIQSVFQMTQLAMKCDSSELREIIVLVYPIVQKGVFTILESLIQNLPMVGQVDNVIDLLRKSIEASYISTFTNHCNYHMRYVAWKTLNVFINSKKFPAALETGSRTFLVQELLKDTKPVKEDKSAPRQHSMSKKSGYAFPEPDETSPLNKMKIKACNEALKVLKNVIYYASPYLEEKLKENIANNIYDSSKTTFKSFYNHKKFPFPYMNDQCRQSLYELSLAILVSSNFKKRVEMQCRTILQTAQKDQSLKIREFLGAATPVCRNILQPKKKSPEAVLGKKNFYDVNGDDKVSFGWDNITTWNVNTSDRGNPLTNTSNRSDKSVNLPNENHKINENERSEEFVSDKDYNSSKMDTSQNSESDGTMGHETVEEDVESSKPFSNTVQTGEVTEEITTKTVSSEEDDSYSGCEELDLKEESVEPEESKLDEEEWNSSSCEKALIRADREKALIRADQNGIGNSSEEEEVSSVVESENEDSSESYVEEEEDAKECYSDPKREAENLTEDERPCKKQRLSEETVEIQEELIENKTEELNNVNCEIKVSTDTTEQDTARSSSPTFEEMCGDLVLHESSELAES